MRSVYLCGGINGLTDSECKDWRKEVADHLQSIGHLAIDPMRRDYRGIELENVEDIIRKDIEDINASDAVIVYAHRPSWGTAMEMFYAYSTGKLVVAIVPSDIKPSPWLVGHAHFLTTAVDSAVELATECFL